MGVVDLHLVVRILHTLTMGALVGSTLLAAFRPEAAARAAERIFWPALGIQVLTGVGNLGSLGENLPGSTTSWGAAFSAKMTLVALLLVLSAARLRLVVRGAPARALAWAYGASSAILAGIVTLAVVMAHG